MLTWYVRGRLVQFYGKHVLVKLTRPANVKINMFKQAHRLAGAPQFFGDSYTWSCTFVMHSWDFLQPERWWRYTHVEMCEYLHPRKYIYVYPEDPHICRPTLYFPTCFRTDLISHISLYIQTCRSREMHIEAIRHPWTSLLIKCYKSWMVDDIGLVNNYLVNAQP